MPDVAPSRLEALEKEVIGCVRCPRLVAWRQAVALAPPARFRGEAYWSRPVPGFGDPQARLHVLGLGTAAHGGNRTGRAMTGNATADWVVGALHEVGLASRATSERCGDGLRLDGVWVSSAVRCPPPGDRPTAAERGACSGHLVAELAALTELRVVLALGGQAWAAATRALDARPRPRFAHGAECSLPDGRIVVGSYHPSRRTTQTGLLSWAMFVAGVRRAQELAGLAGLAPGTALSVTLRALGVVLTLTASSCATGPTCGMPASLRGAG